jgi:hypothetical protein
MVSGIFNILIGALGIYLGLSGRALAFTHSSNALVVIGGVAASYGVYQIWRDRRR